MKIGILTYHRAINYGAFLQACALCNRLIKEGYEAEIIDYRTKKEEVHYSLKKWTTRKKISRWREYCFKRRLINAFQRGYQDSLFKISDARMVSDDFKMFNEFVLGKYDLIISGSDEIWKMGGVRGFPNAYWQIGDTGARKISYAASARCNFKELPEEKQQIIMETINQYEYIGVRDQLTAEELKDYVEDHTKMHINCDPSFLFDFNIKKKCIASHIKKSKDFKKFDPNKKSIVLMCENEKIIDTIYEGLGKRYNLLSVFIYHKKCINLPDLSPLEWLSVIVNADFVIASFFHAICFSIKNNTPFLALGTSSKSSKLSELLAGEFDDNYIKEVETLTAQGISSLVDERMEKVDNSAFLSRMEENFKGFLKVLDMIAVESSMKDESIMQDETINVEIRSVAEKKDIDCCGCGLCSNICPYDAIQMQLDKEGFYRPVIDNEKCVNCGICVKKCINNSNWAGMRIFDNEPRAYAFKHSNDVVRNRSRSGGFFTIISDYVLENGGAVYGSAFAEGTKVSHIRAVTCEERDRMCGSKYVMSPSFKLFLRIKQDLLEGKYVLYSGCPCQVAALKKYVEKQDCSKLILVDVLCHGVPSIRVWNDYVDYCQKSRHGIITEFQFRDKQRFGWAAHMESYIIKGRKYSSNAFTELFYSHQILNRACSKCQFKTTDRVSDFTLGDFWGIDDAITGFNDDKGVSLVLVNTEKASDLFEVIAKNEKFCVEVPMEKCMQNSMRFPYPLPKDREQFWDEYNRIGIGRVIRRRAQKAQLKKVKRFIRKHLRL